MMADFDPSQDNVSRRESRPRISLERALELVQIVAADIERSFASKYLRPINLLNTAGDNIGDYQRIGEFFKTRQHIDQYPGLVRYDVGHRLIRNFLERGDYWASLDAKDRADAFDAIVGRVHYNPPVREYQARLILLDRLADSGLATLIDADLTRMRDDVWKICGHAAGNLNFETYSDAIANPASEIFMWFHVNDIGFKPVLLSDFRPLIERSSTQSDEPTDAYCGPAYT